MVEVLDPEARIRLAMATAQETTGLRDALQVIAEGVRSIAGFGVAAVSVLRQSQEFEFIAVAGHRDAVEALMGRFNPAEATLAELQVPFAEHWGRFIYVPHEHQQRVTPHTWIPEIDYPDTDDAWHAEDQLVAPLLDPAGEIVGLLHVDMPPGGRIPDEETRALLNKYAVQADGALGRALERESLVERVRLAEAARTVVRRASTQRTVQEVLLESRAAIMDGFALQGLWLQVFQDSGHESVITSAEGNPLRVPPDVVAIAQHAATVCWSQQRVAWMNGRHTTRGVVSDADLEVVRRYLHLIGGRTLLFVPLGAGGECLGTLVLTRSNDDLEWSDAEADTALALGHDLGQALLNSRLVEHDQQLVTRLEELDAYKQQLIATMAHELKNPLTAIMGHLELLEEETQDPDVLHSLGAIERGSTRIATIINDLLSLARAEAPNSVEHERVNLASRAREVIELLAAHAEVKGITLAAEIPDAPLVVHGNSADLDMVMTNLIGNAIKYSPAETRVEVRLGRDAGGVRLTVADQGIGISVADQERLFEEFFRSSNPAAREVSGTGLGMAIVARLVARHSGEISVDSELGRGTTFTVTLPPG